MEQKVFKNRKNLKTFIEQQETPHFYIIKEEIRTFFKKQLIVLIYNMKDVENYLVSILKNLLEELNFNNIEINIVTLKNNYIKVNINSNNNALLIGKNGYVLNSLQNLIYCYLSNKFHRRYNVKIDVNQYLQNQENNLVSLAKNMVKKAIETKSNVAFSPMPNNHRKIIHNELKNFTNIFTKSEGNGNKRYVVIVYDAKNNIE